MKPVPQSFTVRRMRPPSYRRLLPPAQGGYQSNALLCSFPLRASPPVTHGANKQGRLTQDILASLDDYHPDLVASLIILFQKPAGHGSMFPYSL